tara:strand:+ start:653 stop:961 length:309 start_codon:yes stop_codon:yes gene_type:complete
MYAISDPTGFVDSTVTLAERLRDLGIESAMIMDGYDDCVIGILERFGMEPIVLYDKEKVINKLVENGCDDHEGANEFYEFNLLGGWHGDETPGFLVRLPDIA